MRQPTVLTIASLLSILLATFHWADDIVFKMSPAGPSSLIGVVILVVWLYGTLALAEKRSGYVIVLLGSLFGFGMPVIHMWGTGGMMGGEIGRSSEAFFFVWTMLALSVASMFSAILSARALWSRPWRGAR